MTTTRDYTLPPDAVEAAGNALDDTLTASLSLEMSRAEWVNMATTAALTAFIDHMVASGDMALESSRMGWSAYSIVLRAPKEPTT